MAQATNTIPRISELLNDSILVRVFQRAERDIPLEPLAVEPRRPEPVLVGGAAVRVREFA